MREACTQIVDLENDPREQEGGTREQNREGWKSIEGQILNLSPLCSLPGTYPGVYNHPGNGREHGNCPLTSGPVFHPTREVLGQVARMGWPKVDGVRWSLYKGH